MTIEQAIKLYSLGTAVVVNDGKVSMRIEKGHRVRPVAK